MLKKRKFKVCLQLNEINLNSSKILLFKKKKWIRLKRFLKKSKKRNLIRKIKINNNLKTINIKKFYKFTLNLKRKILSFYGHMNFKKLKKILNINKYKCLIDRKKNFLTTFSQKSKHKLNHLVCSIVNFESILGVILVKSNFFKSIALSYHAILQGCASVNGNVIRNPHFILKIGDFIKVKRFFVKNFNILFFPKNLLINYKKLVIIYASIPNILDIDCHGKIYWQFLPYLKKLKR